MKNFKLKTCKHCKGDLPLSSYTSTRAHYCNNCRIIRKLEQQKASALRQIERERERSLKRFEKQRDKSMRRVDRVRKQKQKKKVIISLPKLKKKVQRVVNRHCKLRDIAQGCISCPGQSEQGGHYINQGSCSFLRYNTDNIQGQCKGCNHFKSGNLLEYRINLVRKIGKEKVEWLEGSRNKTKKWTREELNELYTRYK